MKPSALSAVPCPGPALDPAPGHAGVCCSDCRDPLGQKYEGAIRVSIAAADDMLRIGVGDLLAPVPCLRVVATTGSGDDALRSTRSREVDVMLVAPRLKGVSSVEVIFATAAFAAPTRVMALVAHPESAELDALMDAGACGYASLSSPPSHLLEAIHRTLGRSCPRDNCHPGNVADYGALP